MDNPDHSTRTITASKKKADTVIINRGSAENVDDLALNKSTGHAQIKAFTFPNQNLFKLQRPRDFTADGLLLGWGVRNDVGIAEHPVSGGVFTVENSVDNIERYETQFNQQNPGEKLQYMG